MDENRKAWLVPGAIILAGIILSITIFSVRQSHILGAPTGDISAVRPVHPSEHIIGDPEAPVIIIEYADIDSPYAKEFQQSLSQLLTEYGPSGRVAWVYRHFPLVDQHRYSTEHAEAAECVASLGNRTAFWRFIDLLQANAPGQTQFNPSGYPAITAQLGIDAREFEQCMSSDRYTGKVAADFENALAIGAEGSPYSVLLVRGKEPAVITGSVPYATLKEIVERAAF